MGLLDGMRFSQGIIGQGQDMLALTEGRRKQSGLAALMGDYASGGAPDMRGIAENGGNPLAVRNDMQAQGDRGMEETAKYAQMFLALPPGQKPQAYAGLVARVNSLKMDHPPIPNEYDPQFDAGIAQFAQALSGSGSDTSGNIQSTFVGADGMRYGVTRDGRTMPLGQNAPNNQIIDTGNGFYGVNKGNLSAAPVMVGQGQQSAPQPPQAPPAGTYQTPQGIVRLSDDLSPEQREAAMMDMANGGNQSSVTLPPRNVAPQQFGGPQLRKAPAAITPFQRESLDLRRDATTAAQEARDLAAKARQDAADLKANQAAQAKSQRQMEAASTANQLVSAIDTLEKHPGFADLGTAMGDFKLKTPVIRNDAKDADANLKNIAGQVALTTMARLKALSSTGTTGFGSLTAPELKLLENSIATLQSDQISNAQLRQSLGVIKTSMKKISDWKEAGAAGGSGGLSAAEQAELEQLRARFGKK